MKSKPKAKKQDEATLLLAMHLKELGLSFEREYQFYRGRKWRFDFVLGGPDTWRGKTSFHPDGTAIEIEGGIWTQGRHTRGAGFLKDAEKYNCAALTGWRVLRFGTQQVLRGEARQFLKEWLCEPANPSNGHPRAERGA